MSSLIVAPWHLRILWGFSNWPRGRTLGVLAKSLGVVQCSITKALLEMAQRGLIEKIAWGRYRILAQPGTPLHFHEPDEPCPGFGPEAGRCKHLPEHPEGHMSASPALMDSLREIAAIYGKDGNKGIRAPAKLAKIADIKRAKANPVYVENVAKFEEIYLRFRREHDRNYRLYSADRAEFLLAVQFMWEYADMGPLYYERYIRFCFESHLEYRKRVPLPTMLKSPKFMNNFDPYTTPRRLSLEDIARVIDRDFNRSYKPSDREIIFARVTLEGVMDKDPAMLTVQPFFRKWADHLIAHMDELHKVQVAEEDEPVDA